MNKYDFNNLSDKDLDALMLDVQQERNRRANIKKRKLIDAFEEAFNALKEAGFDVSCKDSYVSNFDQFEFY